MPIYHLKCRTLYNFGPAQRICSLLSTKKQNADGEEKRKERPTGWQSINVYKKKKR
jgi:hypothetical protein